MNALAGPDVRPQSRSLAAVFAALICLTLTSVACAPPQPDFRADLRVEHPGCDFLGASDWQSDSWTLHVHVEYKCGSAGPAQETWLYQEDRGTWKLLKVLHQGATSSTLRQDSARSAALENRLR